MVRPSGATGLVEAATGGDVDLTADERLDIGLFGLPKELDGTKHVAVVCGSNGVHAQFLNTAKQIAHANRPVQKAVLSVDMKVNKRRVMGHVFLMFLENLML